MPARNIDQSIHMGLRESIGKRPEKSERGKRAGKWVKARRKRRANKHYQRERRRRDLMV